MYEFQAKMFSVTINYWVLNILLKLNDSQSASNPFHPLSTFNVNKTWGTCVKKH